MNVARSAKLVDYVRLASVQHSLVIDPERRTGTHHARREGGGLDTTLLTGGELSLDPPGLHFNLRDPLGADEIA